VFLHYLAKHGHVKITSFHSNVVITAFPEFNQSSNLLTSNSYSCCYRLPKSCNQMIQLWPVGAIAHEKWSWVLCSSFWTVLHAPCTGACMSCVAARQVIFSSTMCLITANIGWDIRYPSPINTIHWLFTWGLTKKTTTFDAATDITTDMQNDECVVTDGSMLYTPFLGLVWCIQSRMKGVSTVTKW